MTTAFLDTSGLIAMVNTDDQWHAAAEAVWAELLKTNTSLVTSSLILIELADGLSRIHHRGLAVQLVDALNGSTQVEVVRVDEQLERLGWQLFRDRTDKNWGMTDCVSMALMTERAIQDAMSADHHFEQAGFNILLRD